MSQWQGMFLRVKHAWTCLLRVLATWDFHATVAKGKEEALEPSQQSGFQQPGFWITMLGFRIPLAGFRIPKPWIPDSTDQNYLDSGFRITLHGAKPCKEVLHSHRIHGKYGTSLGCSHFSTSESHYRHLFRLFFSLLLNNIHCNLHSNVQNFWKQYSFLRKSVLKHSKISGEFPRPGADGASCVSSESM